MYYNNNKYNIIYNIFYLIIKNNCFIARAKH
jgi:hypothetical protein